MLYALNSGERIKASPGLAASCPECRDSLLPKCGHIRVWHWSHRIFSAGCVNEPESQWHLMWKLKVKEKFCEVKIDEHRADIVGNGGVVIELQRSSISVDEIKAREEAYAKMIWLFDASQFEGNIDMRFRGSHDTFRWKWPRKSIWYVRKPMFWDFGQNCIFHVKRLYQDVPCGGWGHFCSASWFERRYMSSVMTEEQADLRGDEEEPSSWYGKGHA